MCFRAVANLAVLAEYCMPFVKPQKGSFVAYKSGNMNEELDGARNAINMLGGEVKQEIAFFLPDTDIPRSLIWVEKLMRTPADVSEKSRDSVKSPLE